MPAGALRESDFAAVGVSGLGRFDNGAYRSLNVYAGKRSEFLNIPLVETTQTLADAGYLQGYTLNLGLPSQPVGSQSTPLEVGYSSLYEYATLDGARDAFAFNTNYAEVTIATVDTSTQPSEPIGDESLMVRTISTSLEEEGPSDELAVWVRVGNLLAATGLIDYQITAEDIATPQPITPERLDQVEALGRRLTETLTAIAAGNAPGLSAVALRVQIADVTPFYEYEGYRRLAGDDSEYFAGYTDDFSGAFGEELTDAYELESALGLPSGDPFDPYFLLRILRFTDAAEAEAYVANLAANPGEGEVLIPDGASAISPETLLFEYDFPIDAGVMGMGQRIVMPIGPDVAIVNIESASRRPSAETAIQLGQAQLDCLNGDPCPRIMLSEAW